MVIVNYLYSFFAFSQIICFLFTICFYTSFFFISRVVGLKLMSCLRSFTFYDRPFSYLYRLDHLNNLICWFFSCIVWELWDYLDCFLFLIDWTIFGLFGY